MSKFKTSITVDLAPLSAHLPPRAYVHGLTFNAQTGEISLEWEHDPWFTGRDMAIDFPLADLEGGRLPATVTDRSAPAPAPEPPPPPAPPEPARKAVPTPPKPPVVPKGAHKVKR